MKTPQDILESFLLKFPQLCSDKLYIQIVWKRTMGYTLDLKNPQTFNEKLQWLKLYDHNPNYTKMVDKYEAKKYVADIIGEEYIIPTLGVYNRVEDINFESLPKQFVLKCTHDSGGLVICPNKENLNVEIAKEKLRSSLKRNYYLAGREWPYKNVKPRIIAESFMAEENENTTMLEKTTDLPDYKFMCYNGKCENLFVCTGRANGDLRVDFFDLEWNHLPFSRKYPNSDVTIPKPENLKKMKSLVERIACDIAAPFVRIDMYTIRKKIYFGEITFYPGGGWESFCPDLWDKKIGDLIVLN